ncbi:hypothetical protein DOCECA_14140 [Pseudomonas sp. E102]
MGPKGLPFASADYLLTDPSPGTVIRLYDSDMFSGHNRRLGCLARADSPAFLSKTKHLGKTGMSLFIICTKVTKKADACWRRPFVG